MSVGWKNLSGWMLRGFYGIVSGLESIVGLGKLVGLGLRGDVL